MPTIVCAKGETDDTVTQCCVKKKYSEYQWQQKVLMLGNGSIYLRQTTKKMQIGYPRKVISTRVTG
jgi:acetone carboxylase gamma subunit